MKRREACTVLFKQILIDCRMMKFPFTGNMLSWVGKRDRSTVWYRLDQVVGNENWHDKFPHSSVQFLRLWESDHRLVLENILAKPIRAKKKKFKFDKRWLDSKNIMQVILEGWNLLDLPTDVNIKQHILSCRRALSQWRRQNDINSENQVQELKERVENFYSNDEAIIRR